MHHYTLINLRFADDVLLFATTVPQLTTMLNDLHNLAGNYGLELHPEKTVILCNLSQRRGRQATTPPNTWARSCPSTTTTPLKLTTAFQPLGENSTPYATSLPTNGTDCTHESTCSTQPSHRPSSTVAPAGPPQRQPKLNFAPCSDECYDSSSAHWNTRTMDRLPQASDDDR